MSAQEAHFQGAEILQSTRTHVRWNLQKLSAPVSFSCHQCGRATTDTAVAIKTTSAGRQLAHCTDCHLRRLTEVASAHEPHAPAVGAVPAPDGAEGVATSRLDETVLIRQPDPGLPHDVVETASELQWTFVIRRHHVEHGQCPLPPQAARRIRTAKVVHLDHGGGFPTVLLDSLHKKVAKEHLQGIRWPPDLLVGTRVTANLDRSRLRLSLTLLERPSFIAKRRFSYAYDPRIIARELPTSLAHSPAGTGVSLDVLVQETIRRLGYLDEAGSALLPVVNLIRDVRSRGMSHQHSSDAIRASVNGLIARKRLTWETGSCAADDVLHFPARPSERTVHLVCYTPFVLPKPKKQRVVSLPSTSSRHGVAGHLMKIEHLGKQASDTAQAAYAEAHRSAGLTGTHQLPKGHTYVKPHKRGGLT
ncbi:hypothetical protein [Streptomyces sp. ID01-9D]|uniref:hypothetical protein n=1 Tax=Streptomyces sp. ID01-9D TaxID=3028659 RepID=UPI0029C4A8A5|nr:hypothetical protein [Streptomyces sp. ID01-9D]MDX5571879.1 hypothetical protein [Streptomyces sp. ID01-9D]